VQENPNDFRLYSEQDHRDAREEGIDYVRENPSEHDLLTDEDCDERKNEAVQEWQDDHECESNHGDCRTDDDVSEAESEGKREGQKEGFREGREEWHELVTEAIDKVRSAATLLREGNHAAASNRLKRAQNTLARFDDHDRADSIKLQLLAKGIARLKERLAWPPSAGQPSLLGEPEHRARRVAAR
jgi:flagellar biosynthesis/type III secretory pathway protein FliH